MAKLLRSNDGVRSDHAAYVAATTVLVCGAIIVLSLLLFSIYYKQLRFARMDLEGLQEPESKFSFKKGSLNKNSIYDIYG